MNTKKQNPYQPFPSVTFRSPYFPINLLLEWLAELDHSPDYLKQIIVRPDIQEAIFLASPVLYSEMFKYLEDKLKPKDKEKFFFSILKYLSRMATRCTPFGLFAGCSVGQSREQTDILLPDPEHYSRHTRLDMNYLCALAQEIAKKEELRHKLLYYPNNSSYVVGDNLRYISYRYQNGNRRHTIVAVDYSDYLHLLLSAAKEGATLAQLAPLLMDEETTDEEIFEFLYELIDKQILISELEPGVTGPELLDQLILTLDKFHDQQALTIRLKTLANLLQQIDAKPIGTTIHLYEDIKKIIKELGITFSEKHLFQSDMLKPCKKAEIDKKLADELLEAITFMNSISLTRKQETILDKFATSFLERYEERAVPLAQLLDTEMGLDLHQSTTSGDITPLLDGIPFGGRQQENVSHAWSAFQSLLLNKVTEALFSKQQEVILTDDDVKNKTAKWDDLPHSIAAMCEVFSYSSNGTSKIFLHSIGGSGAANLLGRFCHVDEAIHKAVIDIIREEERALPEDKRYAEIVHLPESRIGNILARPLLRQYEIPYLAKSGVGSEFQLALSDLEVSVRQKKFILRSKRLNKEIIPKLTTAHNFSNPGAMPIYQFLCNLQNQHQRGGIGLFISGLFNEFPYMPRISYKNIILSLARWHVKPGDLKPIVESKETSAALEALQHRSTSGTIWYGKFR